MTLRRLLPTLLVIIFIFGACQPEKARQQQQKAKYVFYFIGDGASLPQLSLTEAYLAQKSGQSGMKQLNQSKLQAHGWFYTHADNRFITGSAAAGTALATGYKTSINTISQSADHDQNYETIAQKAKKAGMKVGIISSVSIDHATPAVFYAHSDDRGKYYEIGQQLFTSGFDLFAGGGFKEPEGEEGDKPDLYKTESNVKVLQSNQAFMHSKKADLPLYFAHERLQEGAAMPFAIDMTDSDLTLTSITRKSIELLDNSKGFFMMVEGGKIDWACHANDAAATIEGMIDFDNAVGEALKFAKQHPDETLIVVLGDHETGGLTLGNDNMDYETAFELLQYQKLSHEALMLEIKPLIEEKAGFEAAMEFVGAQFGLGTHIELTDKDRLDLKKSWEASVNYAGKDVDLLYGSVQQFLYKAMQMLNRKAGVGWSSTAHTGLPVIVHAHGAGAKAFEGILDNTDIPRLMEKHMGLNSLVNK